MMETTCNLFTPDDSNKNFWLYECVALEDEEFKGIYYEEIGDKSFRKTRMVDTVAYVCIMNPDKGLVSVARTLRCHQNSTY